MFSCYYYRHKKAHEPSMNCAKPLYALCVTSFNLGLGEPRLPEGPWPKILEQMNSEFKLWEIWLQSLCFMYLHHLSMSVTHQWRAECGKLLGLELTLFSHGPHVVWAPSLPLVIWLVRSWGVRSAGPAPREATFVINKEYQGVLTWGEDTENFMRKMTLPPEVLFYCGN